MKTVWRDHGLALFFGLIFLAALAGQALTGVAEYNNQQITDGLAEISLGQYLTLSSFACPGSTGAVSVALSSDPPLRCMTCPATAASLLFICLGGVAGCC